MITSDLCPSSWLTVLTGSRGQQDRRVGAANREVAGTTSSPRSRQQMRETEIWQEGQAGREQWRAEKSPRPGVGGNPPDGRVLCVSLTLMKHNAFKCTRKRMGKWHIR